MFKPTEDTKKVLCFVGFIAAIVAVAASVSVFVTKLLKKKNCKKYYIECDCEDGAEELSDKPKVATETTPDIAAEADNE